jgi:hypothetical protein
MVKLKAVTTTVTALLVELPAASVTVAVRVSVVEPPEWLYSLVHVYVPPEALDKVAVGRDTWSIPTLSVADSVKVTVWV